MADAIPYIDIHDINLSLRDVIVAGNWNLSNLYTTFPPDYAQKLQSIAPRLQIDRADTWMWHSNDKGCYIVGDTYLWLLQRDQNPT